MPFVRTGKRGNHRGFTLIELLVIVAIICAMAGVGVVSVRAGQGAARVKGATRDIFAAIRHARSQALVSQKPVIITYSTEETDGEPQAKIEVTSARLFAEEVDRRRIRTLTGAPLAGVLPEETPAREGKGGGTRAARDSRPPDEMEKDEKDEKGGSLVQDVLFAPIKADVVTGMRLKVVVGEDGSGAADEVRKPRLSVFSNVDYLLGKYRETKAAEAKTEASDGAPATAEGKTGAPPPEHQEPVSVVWETNGRVDPHQVWVYADGQKPEDGLMIRIDRFGAAKVLSGDGREEGR